MRLRGRTGLLSAASAERQVVTRAGADRFRSKISESDSDTFVYDNQIGAPDGADLGDATVIQGGSIVIHRQ